MQTEITLQEYLRQCKIICRVAMQADIPHSMNSQSWILSRYIECLWVSKASINLISSIESKHFWPDLFAKGLYETSYALAKESI